MTTTWDAELADAKAREFQAKLRPEMTVAELVAIWKEYYLATGHKRLGRALLQLSTAGNGNAADR